MKSKKNILTIAIALLLICAIGGTVAWLTATSGPVTNTFTTSDMGVTLTEETTEYKMVPGWRISKDPIVKVASGSEDCYLFVKVEEKGGDITVNGTKYTFDSFLAYAIDEGWKELETGVYFKVINTNELHDADHKVLGDGEYAFGGVTYTWDDNEVLTKPEVTTEMMKAAAANQPKLVFTAYAHQLYMDEDENKFTPAQAWANLNPSA